MATNTELLGLLKKDSILDADDTFNIETMLNQNWDKIDEKFREKIFDNENFGLRINKETDNIEYFNTELDQWIEVKSGSGDMPFQSHKISLNVETDGQTEFRISLNGFNPAVDFYMIFQNRTFLENNDYSIVKNAANYNVVLSQGVSVGTTLSMIVIKGNVIVGTIGEIPSASTTERGLVALTNELGDSEDLAVTQKGFKTEIEKVFQVGNNTKKNMVDALLSVDSKLPITKENTWGEVVDSVSSITKFVGGTATKDDVRTGKTIQTENGVVTGIFTSDATATAPQILSGQTAYVKGNKVTGTIASKTAQTYTPKTTAQTITSGQYLSGTQTIAGDANLIASNIISGKSIFGIGGTATIASMGGSSFASGTPTSAGDIYAIDTTGTSRNAYGYKVTGLNFKPKYIVLYADYDGSSVTNQVAVYMDIRKHQGRPVITSYVNGTAYYLDQNPHHTYNTNHGGFFLPFQAHPNYGVKYIAVG